MTASTPSGLGTACWGSRALRASLSWRQSPVGPDASDSAPPAWRPFPSATQFCSPTSGQAWTFIAQGRTVLVVCTGITPQGGGRIEADTYGLERRERATRMVEWIKILRLLWTEPNASFEGQHYRFRGVTIEPRPAAQPHPPIWIANNAVGNVDLVSRTHRRVARHADGWQTSLPDPHDLARRLDDIRSKLLDEGRDPDCFETHLYHNVNINEDRQHAFEESKRFLETYYGEAFDPARVRSWVRARLTRGVR